MKLTATFLFATVSAFAVGCSASNDLSPSTADESSSALRALHPAEIVGTIGFGDTKTVSYDYAGNEAAKYKALSFTATAGDAIDVWVRSTSGDARVWLLSSTFQNVDANDDASGSTHDAHVTTTARTSGTYYIAIRDKAYDDADFTVTLTGGHSNGNDAGCDPEETDCNPQSSDPFDVVCSGTPLDAAGAGAYFTAGAVSSKTVGAVHVYGRVRSCNQTTGCGPWQRDDSILKDDGGSSSGALRSIASGTVSFGVQTNVPSDAIRYVMYTNATSFRCTLAGACTSWNNLYIHRDGKFWPSKTLNWSASNFTAKPGAGCLSSTIVATNTIDNQRYDEAQALIYATFSGPN